jgi:aerobic-type carbon monoxide dehydrogenase small subunit (CoxS/CutS family)
MANYVLEINGAAYTVTTSPDTPLLWVLRDSLGLTGTKFGCGIGLCGCCTIHLDGRATRSCVTSIAAAAEKKITTIEGLSSDLTHPLQRAWLTEQVPQCGYCQPGQLMTAADLLARKPAPSDAEIVEAMSANICRCGCYERLFAAVRRAVSMAKEGV